MRPPYPTTHLPRVIAAIAASLLLGACGSTTETAESDASLPPVSSTAAARTTTTVQDAAWNATPEHQQVNELLAGIPQDGFTLGSDDAPTTLVVRPCALFEYGTTPTDVPHLIDDYVEPGRLRIEMRPRGAGCFPRDFSREATHTLLVAARQDRAFHVSLVAAKLVEGTPPLERPYDDGFQQLLVGGIDGLDADRAMAERWDDESQAQFDGLYSQPEPDLSGMNLEGEPVDTASEDFWIGPTGGTLDAFYAYQLDGVIANR